MLEEMKLGNKAVNTNPELQKPAAELGILDFEE
jgi:hypothetical protein